ncbi:acyl-CoA reductase-like NAD-dependent aldehyde dehydrogenase [Sinomonas atrocyanea]|uniref:aldehyde dehydrogenase family protein n=1 Tax=Sinomonas atrocyanea TaxID=37927 RepID=UPI0027837FF8|nr:aldehyde dehydrogenase [Sinomonas atrocyanea]MDQ0260997.1 acyl-CoA reductase-like NAD-dependent aldehyde dehydrogenase [Sinomonas atrocyanea]
MSAVLPGKADYAGAPHPSGDDAFGTDASGADAATGGAASGTETEAEAGALAAPEAQRVESALQSARRASALWRRTPQAERSTALREIAAAVESAAHELADLNSRETGRLFDDALEGVRSGAEALRRFAELGLLRSGPSLAGAFSGLDFTVFEPRGVVLGLTSWDDPVAVACAVVGASLAAGNAVVLKPSGRCPALGRRLGRLFASAVPAGVIGTVTGSGAVGAALAEDLRVDAIVHIGSSEAADSLTQSACATGAHLVRGRPGNGVFIVDREVDPGWAAASAAEAAFRHAGQLRSAASRIYVLEDIADDFLEAFAGQARQWTSGERLGPLVDARARKDVHRVVAQALDRGALRIAGGAIPDGSGSYYPPTILTGPAATLEGFTEEVRGPVAAVIRVGSFGEAIAEAAHCPCGASATVLTRDIAHAQIAAAELPVGTVVVNGVAQGATGTDAPGLPQTGSPVGFGPRLLDELSRPKVIHLEPPVVSRPGPGLVI